MNVARRPALLGHASLNTRFTSTTLLCRSRTSTLRVGGARSKSAPTATSAPTAKSASGKVKRKLIQTVQESPPPKWLSTKQTAQVQFAGGLLAITGLGVLIRQGMMMHQSAKEQQIADESAKEQLIVDRLQKALTQAAAQAHDRVGSSKRGSNENELRAAIEVSRALEAALVAIGNVHPSEQQDHKISSAKTSVHAITIAARMALQDSQHKVDLLEVMVSALREQVTAEEAKTSELQAALETSQQELGRSERAREELQASYNGLDSHVLALKTELETALRRLHEAEAQTAELQAHVTQLMLSNTALESKVKSLEGSLARRADETKYAVEAAERRIRKIQAEADASAMAINRMRDSAESREQQLEDMRIVLHANDVAAKKIEDLLKSKDTDLAALGAKMESGVDEAMALYQKREDELAALQSELGAAETAASADEVRHAAELRALRQQLESELEEAALEAAEARGQLHLIKHDMDVLLQKDLPAMLHSMVSASGDDGQEKGQAVSASGQELRSGLESMLAEKEEETEAAKQLLLQELAKVRGEKECMAVEASGTILQVREQVLELQQLREDLFAQGAVLASVRQGYENSRAEAEHMVGASQAEIAAVAQGVVKLQTLLKERELETERLRAELASQVSSSSPPSSNGSGYDTSPTTSPTQPKGGDRVSENGTSLGGGLEPQQGLSHSDVESTSQHHLVTAEAAAPVGVTAAADTEVTKPASAGKRPQQGLPIAILRGLFSMLLKPSTPKSAAKSSTPTSSPASPSPSHTSTAAPSHSSAPSPKARQATTPAPKFEHASPLHQINNAMLSMSSTAHSISNSLPTLAPPGTQEQGIRSPPEDEEPYSLEQELLKAVANMSHLTQRCGGLSHTAPPSVLDPPESTQRPSLPPTLKLVCGGQMIPHADKVERGGEDAWFSTNAGFGAFGVADGVGGWAADGINPAEYARGIVAKCEQVLRDTDGAEGLIEVLEYAQARVTLEGSCTVCLSALRPGGILEVANLGDAGIRVVRGNRVVHATDTQEHEFNMPYQMAHPLVFEQTDTARDAALYQFKLKEGDVVVAGSDGLFDNLWDEQLVQHVHTHLLMISKECPAKLYKASTARRLAADIARSANTWSKDKGAHTPWSMDLAAQAQQPAWMGKLFGSGGKLDDITVVVAIVAPN